MPLLRCRSVPLLLLVILVAACDPAPSDVREWTPADHDNSPAAQNAPPRPKGSARPGPDVDLVELAWGQYCSACHGQRGRGDGPQGPMVRAPDLTRAEWQEKVTDQEMLETIQKGRNKMPKFDLPEPVVKGLVQRIRQSRQR